MSEEETGGVPQADREWTAKSAVTPESPTIVEKDPSLAEQMHEIRDLFGVKRKKAPATVAPDRAFNQVGSFPIPESLRAQAAAERARREAEPKPVRIDMPVRVADELRANYPVASVEERTHRVPKEALEAMRVDELRDKAQGGIAKVLSELTLGSSLKRGLEFTFRVKRELLPALRERLKDDNAMGDIETIGLVEETVTYFDGLLSKGKISNQEEVLLRALKDLLKESEAEEVDVA
ncbi:MAG: hypothetical protein O2877_03020 [bacterium]|nr:hypothetical protein [bacterium]